MMAAQSQILHELLQQDQEPFKLNTYIAERRSQMKKKTAKSEANALEFRKRRTQRNRDLLRNACFLSFQNSPDVRNSPFLDLPSPVKSRNCAAFLQIPTTTAALLVEAAMKIQKHRKSKAEIHAENPGFGIFGSLLKRLKNRSGNKKRALGDSRFSGEAALHLDAGVEESSRISCSCSNRRPSSVAWTENNEDNKSLDFDESSTSDFGSECSEDRNGDFPFGEPRFCTSPFLFSFHESPSFSGRRGNTPELCSPAVSPSYCLKQDKENGQPRNSINEGGGKDEADKEQSSPVSILDPPFEEDDDGLGSGDAEEQMDDYDLNRTYESVQRAKQQLLHRLRRFEKLAALDPIELEKKLLEGYSDDESSSEEHEALTKKGKHNSESFATSDLWDHNMAGDCQKINSRLDVCRETEIDTIELLIRLDLTGAMDGWTKFDVQVDEITGEMQAAICGMLVEELWGELLVAGDCNGSSTEFRSYKK